MVFNKKTKIRFFAKTKRDENGCLLWIGYIDKFGYGRFLINGKVDKAHRVAWKLVKGKIPKGNGYHGTCVCHKCDNKNCVETSHLFLGSQKDNMQDARNKGRKWNGELSGENNPRAKLSSNDVAEIRKLIGVKTQREIGSIFGVDYTQISCIKRGITWKNI